MLLIEIKFCVHQVCPEWALWDQMFRSHQSLSHVWVFATPWIAACQAPLSITNSESTQTHVHWVTDAIQPSHPLSSPSPPAPNPSQHQGLFQWVSSSHQVAKGLEFQHQHQSFQWTPRTDLLRMDWLDLLAVQGTLKSLLQHHSSKAPILRRSVFFTVQLSHPYMTTGKTIALTRQTFVGKVMSLLFNMLSRLVITFLPRSKRLLISWLQSQETNYPWTLVPPLNALHGLSRLLHVLSFHFVICTNGNPKSPLLLGLL